MNSEQENETEDEICDNEDIINPFQKSTHSFLFEDRIKLNNGKIRRVGFWDKVLALLIIILQIFLYIYLGILFYKDVEEDQVPVTVTHERCQNSTVEVDIEPFLSCEANESEDTIRFVLVIAVFICFLIPDIVESCTLFSGNIRMKIVAMLVLFEVFIAITAGVFGTMSGLKVGPINALFSCIGIIFIHDVDEKFRQAVESTQNSFRVLIIYFTAVIIMVVLAIVVKFVWDS